MKWLAEFRWLRLVLGVVFFAGARLTQAVPSQPKEIGVTSNLVVTALRVPRDELSVPYTTYKLNADDTQLRKAARSTPDVFQGIPSVMGQKTAYGQGSPYFRGFTGFRNLLLVDGVRLNNSVFRDGPNQYWSTVDSMSVSDYDVVMGPSSVLYGT